MVEQEQVRLFLKREHIHRGIMHPKGATIVTAPNRATRMIEQGIAELATVLDLGSLRSKSSKKYKSSKKKSKLGIAGKGTKSGASKSSD